MEMQIRNSRVLHHWDMAGPLGIQSDFHHFAAEDVADSPSGK
jgi:hypothetical protein